ALRHVEQPQLGGGGGERPQRGETVRRQDQGRLADLDRGFQVSRADVLVRLKEARGYVDCDWCAFVHHSDMPPCVFIAMRVARSARRTPSERVGRGEFWAISASKMRRSSSAASSR